MFTALLEPNSQAITIINSDHSDLPYYAQGKETLYEGRKKEVLQIIEQWYEDNFVPDELRIIQTVKGC